MKADDAAGQQVYGCDVLFFSAHPDDAEFAAGGTLIKLAKKYEVVNVILTHGEAGTFGNPEVREKEAKAASGFAGYTVEFLGFCDNFVEDNAENAHRLAQVIRKHRPKIIFAPYHTNNSRHTDGISHPDHLNTGRLAVKAARFAKFRNAKLEGEAHCTKALFFFMVPAFTKPSFTIDVSESVADLPKLWACHESQIRNLAKGTLEDKLIAMRKFLGLTAGCEYAEGFMSDAPLCLDIDSLF